MTASSPPLLERTTKALPFCPSVPCIDVAPSSSRRNAFLSLPPEILVQIAGEVHAADVCKLRLVHPRLYHLFSADNNFFWFKTTLMDYLQHYGPPPKSPSSDSSPPSAPSSLTSDFAQSPFLDALRRFHLPRGYGDSSRTSNKNKELLYKYDSNFDYFARIRATIKDKQGRQGCQICCVGTTGESKYFAAVNKSLCQLCFDDLTISQPKIRHLKLGNTSYRFIKYRRQNGSLQFACWLPDVLRKLPSSTNYTSIYDIERSYDSKYNASKQALSEYRDQTREAVRKAAIDVYRNDDDYAGFRAVFSVEKMQDWVPRLGSIPTVEQITRPCKNSKKQVWYEDVARTDVLPQFDIIEDEGFKGQRKYTFDNAKRLKLVVGGRRVVKRGGVPAAIQSAVFKYHEERFIRLGAGWDHRGMQGNDILMFGYCQICMDKKLKEAGQLPIPETPKLKRRRPDVEGEYMSVERKRGKIKELTLGEGIGGIVSQDEDHPRAYGIREEGSQQLIYRANTSAHSASTSCSSGHTSPSTPPPLPSHVQQTHPSNRLDAETALAQYLPKLYTAETAANFPMSPRRFLSDSQQAKYTGADLAAHYEAVHTERFYSGEDQGNGRRYETGKGGFWFWNLGQDVGECEPEIDGQTQWEPRMKVGREALEHQSANEGDNRGGPMEGSSRVQDTPITSLPSTCNESEEGLV